MSWWQMTTFRNGVNDKPAQRLLLLLDTLPADPAVWSAEDIHRIRVAIKRTRAWLKMCRAVSGDTPAYQQLVADLRHLSHTLAGLRDRDVALQTLARLIRKYPGKKAQALIETFSQQIAQGHVPIPDMASFNQFVARVREQLPAFSQLQLTHDGQIAVIQRTWLNMCKAGEAGLQSETCTDLHAWRKRAKTLGYQLEIVKDGLPHHKRIQAGLNKLGHYLGEVHDLCFVQTLVEEIAATLLPLLKPTPVLKRIQRERSRRIASCRKQYRRICLANKG